MLVTSLTKTTTVVKRYVCRSTLKPKSWHFHYATTCQVQSSIALAFDHFSPNSDKASHLQAEPQDPIEHPIVILHGLFGSRQNWRTIAKRIAQKSDRDVFVLDLRNHGDSGATPGSTSYLDYAIDVETFIDHHRLKNVNLIGHSMGGKVAMSLALKPSGQSIISKLAIVDISPLKGQISKDFRDYLQGMKEINSRELKTRKEADDVLAKYANELETRQFILTNLKKATGPNAGQEIYKIRLPLDALSEQILSNQVGDFPFDPDQPGHPSFHNPTLFIKGKNSKYINRHSSDSMKKFFPTHGLVVLDAGHWVHAEKPNEFINIITQFFR